MTSLALNESRCVYMGHLFFLLEHSKCQADETLMIIDANPAALYNY
jgi:hypothetical protein